MDTGAFRSGYAAIVGRPNVGKSSLLNAFLKEKIAIVSDKPQTTRDRLFGIYTDDTCQIIFTDTPGLIQPQDQFNEYLMNEAVESLRDVDVVLLVLDAMDPNPLPPESLEALSKTTSPVLLVVNKADLVGGNVDWGRYPSPPEMTWQERFTVSARSGTGLDELLAAIRKRMPEGPLLYDPEMLSDRDLRYLVAERVREKIFNLTRREIPYGVATQVDEFREGTEHEKTFISINIFVERESQKGIVVGANASMIKRIGQEARPEIEELVGGPVFLELRVRLRKKWRKDSRALQEFGYQAPKESRQQKGRRRNR